MKNWILTLMVGCILIIFDDTIFAQSISGKVYIDLNSSGTYDSSDYGFRGATIYLRNGCQTNGLILRSTFSDAKGSFSFANLPFGEYRVEVSETSPNSPNGSSLPSLCCFIINSSSQNETCDMGYPPSNCSSNPYSVDNICQQALDNPLCDLRAIGDFACGQNPSVLGPWADSSHCGGLYQNTSFYGFIAGTGNYSIQFTVFGCAGTGVQYGIMDACNPDGPFIVCNGNSNTGTVTVDCSSLIPGKNYVFWMDGYSGSVCSYYILVIGDFKYYKMPDIVDIVFGSTCSPYYPQAGTLQVAAIGSRDDLFLENIKYGSLFWEMTGPDGNTINITKYVEEDGTVINLPFPTAGTYQICVSTDHPCEGMSAPFCKDFVFEDEFGLPFLDLGLQLECDSSCNQTWGKKMVASAKYDLTKIDSFHWQINQNSSAIITSTTAEPTLDINSLIPGDYDICISIDPTPTSSKVVYCKKITIKIDYSTVKKYFSLCYLDFPWNGETDCLGKKILDEHGNPWVWTKGPITKYDLFQGKPFTSELLDHCGCPYTQIIEIDYQTPGQPCDDHNPKTKDDKIQENCTCTGTDTSDTEDSTLNPYKIYPNPASETMTISNDGLFPFTFQCFDMSGNQVALKSKNDNDRVIVDVANLRSGVYILLIQSKGKRYPLRFVKM